MDSTEKDIIVFLKAGATYSTYATNSLELIKLRLPKGQVGVYCVLGPEILELQKVEPSSFGSWFIDQRVSSTRHYFIANKIDPRFLLLPHIMKNGERYSPIEQLITSDSECNRIPLGNVASWKLEDICDVNAKFEDMILCKYNEEKMMSWLTRKVDATAAVLKSQRLRKASVESALVSSKFNMAGQSSRSIQPADGVSVTEKPDTDDVVLSVVDSIDISMAVQLVSDYLPDSVAALLTTRCVVSEVIAIETDDSAIVRKRKTDWEVETEMEKETARFIKPAGNSNAAGKVPAVVAPTSAMKKKVVEVQKAAAGMKPMTSFFSVSKK